MAITAIKPAIFDLAPRGPRGPAGTPGDYDYPTLLDALNESIPVIRKTFRTGGYAEPGDGGGGLYYRVPSEPDHPGKGQSLDGGWWKLSGPLVRWQQFGGNTGDAAAAINAMADYMAWHKDNGQEVAGEIYGWCAVETSIRVPRPAMNFICNAAIAADAAGIFTTLPKGTGEVMTNPEGVPVRVVIDTYRGRQSTFSGHLYFYCGNGVGLAPIGNSLGIFSDVTYGPNMDGQGGSNITWGVLDIQSYDYGIFIQSPGLGWEADMQDTVPVGTQMFADRRVFEALDSGDDPAKPPYVAALNADQLEYVMDAVVEPGIYGGLDEIVVKQAAIGLDVDAGDWVVNAPNTYQATISTTLTILPVHTGATSTGTDGRDWVYRRPHRYWPTWAGAHNNKIFVRDSRNAFVFAGNGGDDSFWADVRFQECRQTAILNQGGQINIGSCFISAALSTAPFRGGDGSFQPGNPGYPWAQNGGLLNIGTCYINGEWNNGCVGLNASVTKFVLLRPDGGYKAPCLFECHPDCTRIVADLGTLHEAASTAATNNDYLMVSGSAAPTLASTITWATGGGGSAYVLHQNRNLARPTADFRVIVRPISGTLPTSGTVTDGVTTWTVKAKTYPNLCLSGIVGAPIVAAPYPLGADTVARRVEIKLPFKGRTVNTFIVSRPNGALGQNSQDLLVAKTLDRPEGTLNAVRDSELVVMSPKGLRQHLSNVIADRQLLLEDGEHQDFTIVGARLVLPSNRDGTVGFGKVYAPVGATFTVEMINPGTAPGGYPFLSDAQHVQVWRGRQPVFPVSGRCRVRFTILDGFTLLGESVPDPAPYDLGSVSGTVTLNGYNALNFVMSLGGTTALANPVAGSISAGMEFTLLITHGGNTLNWGTAWKRPSGFALSGSRSSLRCRVNSTTDIIVIPEAINV